MAKSYLLFPRNGVFYAKIRNPETGILLTARSTRTQNRDDAIAVVCDWIRSGLPRQHLGRSQSIEETFSIDKFLIDAKHLLFTEGDVRKLQMILKSRGFFDKKGLDDQETIVAFLERFWSYEESPYVKEKLAHGHRIGKRHCLESFKRIRVHWKPFFGPTILADVSRRDLNAFSLFLSTKGLSANTINKILYVGFVAFRWAVKNEQIQLTFPQYSPGLKCEFHIWF